jgi:glyoxylase I family protein
MIKGIHHVGLVVRDLAAAQRYYGAAAGMRQLPEAAAQVVAPAHDLAAAPADLSLLAGPNGYLLLIAPRWAEGAPVAEANSINRPGIRHFCVQNHDCAILERAVGDHGGSLIAPPLDLGTGNQYAYARDGEGNIMEIEGLPYAPQDQPTWLGHVALVTRDIDRAIEFYAALFAAPLQNRGKFGPGPQFDRMGGLSGVRIEGAWLPAGNLLLELWQFHAPQFPGAPAPRAPLDPGFSHICLETDDLEADAARLVALGGRLAGDSAENGRFRSILACDPEGNSVQLLAPREPDGPHSLAALAEPALRLRIEAGRFPTAGRAGSRRSPAPAKSGDGRDHS